MPSKHRKKKPKKKVEPKPLWQFELTFDDVTMQETEGIYEDVKRLVEEDYGPHDWNVKSNLTIQSAFGMGNISLDFKADRAIRIINYSPGGANVFHNPDISCLMQWSQLAGWKIPQPTEASVRSNLMLWKHMWETLLIDSDYLDQRFGIRSSLRQTVNTEELDPDDLDDVDDI